MTDRSENSLTEILDKVAQANYERSVERVLKEAERLGEDRGFPKWEDLDAHQQLAIKSPLLPIIWDVLNIVDAEPLKAKRGDEVESWLTRARDQFPRPVMPGLDDDRERDVLDALVTDYQRHADTGLPLNFPTNEEN